MGLRDIDIRDEYRSNRNDIVTEFFFPCLNNCIKYDRCVDFLLMHSLIIIATGFDKFISGKAKLRLITGHRFRMQDLIILTKLFSRKQDKVFDGMLIKDSKMQRLQKVIDNGGIEIKIAIPNSEQVADSFSERIGIFLDEDEQRIAFTGTSRESFSVQTRDFESVDVFTSWNDRSRVETKVSDFEDLWANKTKYVEVHDFMDAEKNNLLKFDTKWAFVG